MSTNQISLKLVALATDKFIADVVHDAMENQRGVRLDPQPAATADLDEEVGEKRPLAMQVRQLLLLLLLYDYLMHTDIRAKLSIFRALV